MQNSKHIPNARNYGAKSIEQGYKVQKSELDTRGKAIMPYNLRFIWKSPNLFLPL